MVSRKNPTGESSSSREGMNTVNLGDSLVTNPYDNSDSPPLEPESDPDTLLFGEILNSRGHDTKARRSITIMPVTKSPPRPKTYDLLENTLQVPAIDRSGQAVRDLSGPTLRDMNPDRHLKDTHSPRYEFDLHLTNQDVTSMWNYIPNPISRPIESQTSPSTIFQLKNRSDPFHQQGSYTRDESGVKGLPNDLTPFSTTHFRDYARKSQGEIVSRGKRQSKDWPCDQEDVENGDATQYDMSDNAPIYTDASSDNPYATRGSLDSPNNTYGVKGPKALKEPSQPEIQHPRGRSTSLPHSSPRTSSWSPPRRPLARPPPEFQAAMSRYAIAHSQCISKFK
jgi:hypothetical protein